MEQRDWAGACSCEGDLHANSDSNPVRELPYGPAAMLHQEAGQMAASDYMHPSQKLLAALGASTDG